MSEYRLEYIDSGHKFVRADRLDAIGDSDAIEVACQRRLPV